MSTKKIKSKKDLKEMESIKVLSSVEATVMPKYNPYAVGHGVYQSKKHPKRSTRKNETRRLMAEY